MDVNALKGMYREDAEKRVKLRLALETIAKKENIEVTEADLEATEKRIIEKIKSVTEAYKMADDDIPPCTQEERWSTATKYAVMKEGRKTALKVCDDRETAELFMKSQTGDLYIQERPGEDKRCMDYCPCAEFCSYYKALLKAEELSA